MIGKSFVLALCLCICGSAANAGPYGKAKNFVKTHPRFTAAATTLVASSLVEWFGADACQRGDVERCNGGYGSRTAIKSFNIGVGVGMLAASEACWKDQPGWKFCYGLAYGVPAYQTVVGIKDFASYKPESDSASKSSRKLKW